MPAGIYETERPCVICGAWFKTRNGYAKFCEKCKPDSRRFGRVCKQRYSGRFYRNSSKRLEEIRAKYADGIPDGTVESMVDALLNMDIREDI